MICLRDIIKGVIYIHIYIYALHLLRGYEQVDKEFKGKEWYFCNSVILQSDKKGDKKRGVGLNSPRGKGIFYNPDYFIRLLNRYQTLDQAGRGLLIRVDCLSTQIVPPTNNPRRFYMLKRLSLIVHNHLLRRGVAHTTSHSLIHTPSHADKNTCMCSLAHTHTIMQTS